VHGTANRRRIISHGHELESRTHHVRVLHLREQHNCAYCKHRPLVKFSSIFEAMKFSMWLWDDRIYAHPALHLLIIRKDTECDPKPALML
jgi:hypothetical protein